MSGLERSAYPVPGAKFERIDGQVTFKFVIDGGSIIGPRPATAKDKENHLGAWRLFEVSDALSPLDHDGDGKPGGSLPDSVEAAPVEVRPPAFDQPEDPLLERDALRRDLTMLGVRFDRRWGVPSLQAALDEATTPKDA